MGLELANCHRGRDKFRTDLVTPQQRMRSVSQCDQYRTQTLGSSWVQTWNSNKSMGKPHLLTALTAALQAQCELPRALWWS
ncbi:hypothetical protein AV530_019567 [Patagioenas fasciata monilis]|uniref:Uncharacterized protein n=1 Tax=Patagioenas fasciata monilis TaxID=372326 RepID=A0A1V4JDN2_PATFA|nr:hypothetical protein AV530_019567 [Patagioenas fasciata monilis]